MNERPIDRIKALADWLIANKVVKTMYAFENVCGFSRHYVRNLLATQKGNPGIDAVAKIFDAIPIANIEWLITGSGEMIKDKSEDAMLSLGKSILINMYGNMVKDENMSKVKVAEKVCREKNLTDNEKLEILRQIFDTKVIPK